MINFQGMTVEKKIKLEMNINLLAVDRFMD